jgi:nucleolar protein 12
MHGLKKRKSAPEEPQQQESPPKHKKQRDSKGEKAKKRKSEARESKATSAVESSSAELPGTDLVDTIDPEEESGPSTIVHESLLKGGEKSNQRASVRKEKHAPQDESEEQRNLRTIFVGNLSSEVAQKRVSH